MIPELKEQFSKKLRDMAQVLVFEKEAIFSYLLTAIDDLTEWVDQNFDAKCSVGTGENMLDAQVMPKIADGLLPCPFCGGNDCLWSEDGYPEVKCLTHSKDSAEVREKWNTRK